MLNELEKMIMDNFNESEGVLREDEPNCPLCKNRRYFKKIESHRGDEYIVDAPCVCLRKIKSFRLCKRSGLAEQIKEFRFDNFTIDLAHQKKMFRTAQEFLKTGKRSWLVMLGQTGCGKTHICTAVCAELMNRGYSVRYMRWAVELKRLKGLAMDTYEYAKAVDEIFSSDVIYIDDIFKRGKKADGSPAYPTDADVKLAFEIIDTARALGKTLIISGEDILQGLINIDEAIAGRISQKAGQFLVQVNLATQKNFRLVVSA